MNSFDFYAWGCLCKNRPSLTIAERDVRLVYTIGDIHCNYIITDKPIYKQLDGYYFTIGEFDFMSKDFFPFPKSLKEILHYKKLRMLE